MTSKSSHRTVHLLVRQYGLVFGALAAVVALLAGCASTAPEAKQTVPEEYFSGFLGDYSRLEQSKDEPGNLVWINPKTDLRNYDAFIIDPVVLHVAPALVEESRPNPENAARITEYFREALIREVSASRTVTDRPAKGVARARVAITGALVERQNLKAYQFIPVALVITGVGEATGERDKLAVVFVEAELVDSLTGETLAETVQQGVAKVPGDTDAEKLTEQQVKSILDHWASKLRGRLEKYQAEPSS